MHKREAPTLGALNNKRHCLEERADASCCFSELCAARLARFLEAPRHQGSYGQRRERLANGAASPWNRSKRARKRRRAGQGAAKRLVRQTPHHSRASANFWNARARCDRASEPSAGMPCFSSALISPKVRL